MTGRRRIGGWCRCGKLARSANAGIWRVTKDGSSYYAMKVPHRQSRHEEPYQRFEREVHILRQLSGTPGVVEVIESHLPEKPSKAEPGYYVMPVMRPATETIGALSVNEALEGVLQIARVLAALAERKITHRDIKPDNLFLYDGQWVVSDFGLVKGPEWPAITEPGKKIGSMWYIAPELVNPRGELDYAAADVYSLGKTLWVLLTGMRFPVPGPHLSYPRWAADLYSVASYAPMPPRRGQMLDSLLQRATHGVPGERPGMGAFADEVESILRWEGGNANMTPADLSEMAKRIAAATRPELDQAELRRLRAKQLGELVNQLLLPALDPIHRTLSQMQSPGLTVGLGQGNDIPACHDQGRGGSPIVTGACAAIEVRMATRKAPRLLCGFLTHARLDGHVCIQAGHHLLTVANPPKAHEPFAWHTLWSGYVEVPFGSVNESRAVGEFTRELSNRLVGVMQRFTELVEQ